MNYPSPKLKLVSVALTICVFLMLAAHNALGQNTLQPPVDVNGLRSQWVSVDGSNTSREHGKQTENAPTLSSGLDLIVAMPTLVEQKDENRTLGYCEENSCNGGDSYGENERNIDVVVVPDEVKCQSFECDVVRIEVPFFQKHVFYGKFGDYADKNQVDVKLNTEFNPSFYEGTGMVSHDIRVKKGGLSGIYKKEDVFTFDVPSGSTNDILKIVEVGELGLELIYENREGETYRIRKSVNIGTISTSSIGKVNSLLGVTSDIWNDGIKIAGKLPYTTVKKSSVWYRLGRIMAWNEAAKKWEGEAYSEITLRSMINGIDGFNAGLSTPDKLVNKLETSGIDPKVQSTPTALRIDPRPKPDVQVPEGGKYTVDDRNRVRFDARKSTAFEDFEVESYSWSLEGGNFSSDGFLPDPIKTGTGRTFTVNFEEDLRPEDIDVAERPGSEFPYRLYLTVTDEIGQSKTKRITFGIKCGWNNISNTYDQNNDCFMSTDELRSSITSWVKEEINTEQLNKIITDWASVNRYWQ